MRRKFILIGVAILLLAGVILSWAATSGGQNLSISSGSTASGGGVADVTALSSSFTITQGKAQKINGVELFRIDLGNSSYKDKIKIHFYLLNPEDMGQVLNNPHAFINVQVCYKVDSGEDFTLGDGTKVKKTSATGMITLESGETVLTPTMGLDSTDNDTYWVLGSITTPGGVPSGQQSQLTQLRFHCEVRL